MRLKASRYVRVSESQQPALLRLSLNNVWMDAYESCGEENEPDPVCAASRAPLEEPVVPPNKHTQWAQECK